jgi:predicted nucleic acid-binding protein
MRIVLDTNVFVSGVFFSGPPYQILKAWRDDQLQLAISKEILEEYQRVGEALAAKSRIIVSGDKHLLKVSGFRAIQVLKPRDFADAYLKETRKK